MHRFTIYILALGVFLTATSELVISGILTAISNDLHISLALGGQLITVYSIAFAVGTPLIVSLTSRLGRKKVLLGSLILFILGCLTAFASQTISVLMVSRVILGGSAGVYLVTTFGAATKLVPVGKLGSAISTIVLGFSCAMILGVPLGMIIADWLGWQAIFILLALSSLLIAYTIYRLVPDLEGDAPASFGQQMKVLGSVVIVSGLFITLFKEAGNSVFFTYLVPYMQNVLHVETSFSSAVMLVLGLFGAVGSRLGGYGIDRWGASRILSIGMMAAVAPLLLLPLVSATPAIGLLLISIMVSAMFATGPAIQSYFIQQAPQSSNFVLSLNTSVIHIGLAAGAGVGGVVLDSASSLVFHPWVASSILLLGLAAAWVSFIAGKRPLLRPGT